MADGCENTDVTGAGKYLRILHGSAVEQAWRYNGEINRSMLQKTLSRNENCRALGHGTISEEEWRFVSILFGEKLFSANWQLCVFFNYYFKQDGTFVKDS